MIYYRYGDLAVRALEESDAELLVHWLSDPRVLEFYEGRDRPLTMETVKEQFYDRSIEIDPCIVQYQGKDIGYIQFYPIGDEEKEEYGYSDFAENIYGMDQFIGEPDYWNRGIGTELVRSMVDYLIREKRAGKIVMDPQTWNARALKVYEKCGFVKVKLLPRHEWHEGEYRDCWLMEYRNN